jgi:hypothetical protein
MQVDVVNWKFWSAENTDEIAPARAVQLPASIRRRLNKFGRSVGNMLADYMTDAPLIVFASRYGDAERSVNILQEIAEGEPISPMQFSLSVHNAVSGVLSIGWKLTEMQSVISAGAQTIQMGLIEAAALAQEFPDKKVLFVYVDYPLPEIFGKYEETCSPAEIAVLVLQECKLEPVGTVLGIGPSNIKDGTQNAQKLAALKAVLEGQNERVCFCDYGASWEVSRNVA